MFRKGTYPGSKINFGWLILTKKLWLNALTLDENLEMLQFKSCTLLQFLLPANWPETIEFIQGQLLILDSE